MKIRFWGTRGSIATPGFGTARFGGNTSCVEVVTNSGQRFILDCGTGARLLGMDMMAHATKPIEATILLSHTHWDHIQGFPFFAPVFVPGGHITVCGPNGTNNFLPETLAGQMEYTYFPVKLEELGARIEYRTLREGEHEINGVRVRTQLLNHPAVTLGYRIEADGVSVMYLCDHEPYWEPLWRSEARPGDLDSILHAGDRRHAEFLLDADVVIHDAQYTSEEYPAKKNWGHSTYRYAVELAAAVNVKRLFLTHHDPAHDDEFLSRLEEKARAAAEGVGSRLQVSCAREGQEESFEDDRAEALETAKIVLSTAELERKCSILVIDDDEDLRFLARRILAKNWEVVETEGGTAGLALLKTKRPDLVLLDLLMPAPNGFDVLQAIRRAPETREIPVVVLTSRGDEESLRRSFELGATDYLEKPFTAPQLEVRVRAILGRTLQTLPKAHTI